MQTYAAKQVSDLIERGPSQGEDFYRLQMTGNGATKHVNVTEQQAMAIAAVLNFENFEDQSEPMVGHVFSTILTSEFTLRDVLALAAEVQS